ncbi:unnamed protein product [Caenorhabditis nigoni]
MCQFNCTSLLPNLRPTLSQILPKSCPNLAQLLPNTCPTLAQLLPILQASFIFSRHNTLVIIAIVWFIAFCHIFPYFWYDECYITYDPISWTWNFAATRCGHIISTYTDYYTSVAIFIAMSSVDFSTLILLIIHRKHSHFTSNDEAIKRRKVEIRFFMQSCLQGILFFYEIFNFYYVSTLNTNQWYVFFTATFAWEICHCLDGFVVVLFHFRRRIFLGDSTVTCCFGLLINVLVIITIRKSPHFVNSYGTLAKNHTFLNIICLLVYLLWVTPMTYTQSLSTANSTLGKIMGQLHILFWTSLLYSHLFLSLNRFASLIFPTISRLIFSHIVCLSLILSTWLIGLLHIVIRLFWDRTCYPIYDPATWIWSEATCGDTFIIQYLCILISGISLLLNLSTWILISEETIRRHPIESKLLREELWRTLGFLMAATSSNVLSGWLGERWQKYLLTCVVWQGYYLLDGLIVLVFHFHRKLLAEHKIQEPHHTPSFIHVDHPGHHSSPHGPIIHHPVHFSRVDTS